MLRQFNDEMFVGLYGVSFGGYDCDDTKELLALFSSVQLASAFEYAARLKVSQKNPRLELHIEDDCWHGETTQRYREKSPLYGYCGAAIILFCVDVDPDIPDYDKRGIV